MVQCNLAFPAPAQFPAPCDQVFSGSP
jgi:hypothetical protein